VTIQIARCPYGQPALETLRGVITDFKRGDPLLPVTVVVSRGNVALGVRRALASEAPSSGRPGICNVTFVTLAGLADTIAQGTLADGGRLPLTDAVLRSAASQSLSAEDAPLLGSSREHPSTIDALIRTYRELRPADDAALSALSKQSERSAEVVAVLRGMRERTAQWFDGVDLLNAAADMTSSSAAPLGPIGSLVVFLPSSMPSPAARLIGALAATVACTAIIGVTGDARADELADAMEVSLLQGGSGEPGVVAAVPVPVGDQVLSAASSDAEVHMVLRDAMARAEAGTPLEHITIAHGGSDQYVNLLHNALGRAGIPFNGGGVRPLSATVAGRILLGLLRLPDLNWRRDDVVQWLHTGPVQQDRKAIPSARWDGLSAEAGVVEGIDEWRTRLLAHADVLRNKARHGGWDDERDVEVLREAWLGDAAQCESAVGYLNFLAERLAAPPDHWEPWAEWAISLLHDVVGGSVSYEKWPPEERAAAEAVEAAVGQLAHLDRLGHPCAPVTARLALEAELSVPSPQISRFGQGIWVTPVSGLVGLSTEVLYVVGMHDGAFPARPADDVLLPDRERQEVDGGSSLPLRGIGTAEARRDYLAALAGAKVCVLTFPRGNQRDGRELRPSRWVLDALGEMVSPPQRLFSRDVAALPLLDHFREEPSFISAVRAVGAPIDLTDRDTRSLLRWSESGRSLAGHHLLAHDLQLSQGVELALGRHGGFTRFNGNIGEKASGIALVPGVLSATRLEQFSKCPRQYFFESVLQVVPRPMAERALTVDRLELGTLLHKILERFVSPLVGLSAGPESDELLHADRLLGIAGDEIARFERDGLAGPLSTWRVERTRLLRSLRAIATAERQWRHDTGLTTEGVEVEFGGTGQDPVMVPGPVPVSFRGKIDRSDARADGVRVVTDYKSGSPRRFRGLVEDHFLDGTALQLAIYGMAAGASADQPVVSEYWCVGERGGLQRFGFPVTPDVIAELGEVVETLTGTLAGARFPANPGEPGNARKDQCMWCPFDAICPNDRLRTWEDVRGHASLARYAALAVSR
jgi:ATP-dependent helicase/nuclease subunit B